MSSSMLRIQDALRAVADVEHDAVRRRHDAEAGVGEEREHRTVATPEVSCRSRGTRPAAC